jgi:hypothetical protein
MRFVILLKQKGEGCDYMIGCGYRYKFFDAKDMDDALYMIRTMERENYEVEKVFGHRADEMEEALILPVDKMVDVLCTKSDREKKEEAERNRLQDETDRLNREADAKEREAKERAEYERLQKKFGGEN